ncbi:MAG: hypothetical protein ACRED2_04055, partial [Methylocella sp.]
MTVEKNELALSRGIGLHGLTRIFATFGLYIRDLIIRTVDMALGDGIRRNIADVSQQERERLRDAFIKLQQKAFPGHRQDPIPGGVTYWFKQDEIHAAT